MKLTNLSTTAKIEIGKALVEKTSLEFAESLTDESLVDLGSVLVKIINDNRVKQLTDATLKDILDKLENDNELLDILRNQEKKFMEEYQHEVAQFPGGITASTYCNAQEYASDAITSRFYSLGFFSSTTEEDAKEKLAGLLYRIFDNMCIKNETEMRPVFIRYEVLTQALANIGIEEPLNLLINFRNATHEKSIDVPNVKNLEKHLKNVLLSIQKEFSKIKDPEQKSTSRTIR